MSFQTTVSADDYAVKFVRIEVDQIGDEVLVRWLTDSEINNSFFTIQRSNDGGLIWQDIGIVNSSGTTPGSDSYEFTDTDPLPGSIVYRLRQTDFDGTYTYSFKVGIIVTNFISENDDTEIQVYPNPSDDFVTIESDGGNLVSETTTVQMMDITGKVVAIELDFNDTQIQLRPIQKLPGIYFVMIANNDQTIVKKVQFK